MINGISAGFYGNPFSDYSPLAGSFGAPVNGVEGPEEVKKPILNPGESTKAYVWKTLDFMQPQGAAAYEVKITQYQIDDDWIRMIQKFNQPKKKLQIP